MIDFHKERTVTLQEVSKLIPTVNGKPVHTVSIWRWCTRGIGGVKLEYGRLGRRMVTTTEALSRFMNRLAENDENKLVVGKAPIASPLQREQQIADAERNVADFGIR